MSTAINLKTIPIKTDQNIDSNNSRKKVTWGNH